MSRGTILIIIGLLTMLAPFSGLPTALRTFLLVIFGGVVFGMGVALRSRDMLDKAAPSSQPPTTNEPSAPTQKAAEETAHEPEPPPPRPELPPDSPLRF